MSSPTNQKPARPLTNFLVVYFKCAFFLCFCPFQLCVTENGRFKCGKSFIQSVICATLTGLALLHIIAAIRSTSTYILSENTGSLRYFILLNIIFTYCFHISSVISFWFYRHRFVCILNFIQSINWDIFPAKSLWVIHNLFKIFMQNFYGFEKYFR